MIKTYIKQESSINAESHLSYINYLISFLKTRNGKEITKRVLNGVLDKVSILLHKNVTEKNLNDLPVYLIFKLEGLKRKIIRTFFRYYDLLNNYEEARYSDVKLIESCYSHPFSPLCRV